MHKFGVFYTCYKEVDAVDYSIGLLKNYYPNCPIYLVSDGGSDYSFLESKFTNLKTKISWDSRGISQNLTFEKWSNLKDKNIILKSINEFFKRNLEAIEYCETESILIMEPDVLVRNNLNHFPSKINSLLGSRINKPDHEGFFNVQKLLKNIEGSVEPTHYGSTPAFYYSDSFKEVYDFVKNNQELVLKIINCDPNFVCYDTFLTVLFAACGYHEIFNPDIIECLRCPDWASRPNPLVHQYRNHYPKAGSGYDGRHSNDL